jgi:transforming growth factor-beta-induced protein
LPPSKRRNSNGSSGSPVKGQRSSNQKGVRKLSSTSTGSVHRREQSKSGKGGKGKGKAKAPKDNFLQYIFMKSEFSGLTELVIRARLAGDFESSGPFTLFAPTNNALSNLPEGTNKLLFEKDAFLPHLITFLLNHSVNGQVLSDDLSNGLEVTTNAGESIRFNILLGDFFVSDILISDLDNLVTNGVLHEIDDNALAPSWVFSSLTSRVAQTVLTSTLLTLLERADIDLSGAGEFTLVAPINDAFDALSLTTVACLVNPNNVGALQDVLKFHVLKGVLLAADFEDGKEYKTLEGGKVKVTSLEPLELEGSANFLFVNSLAYNGVVHFIDTVLDPGTSCAF